MWLIVFWLLSIAILSYLLGSIPFSYLAAKIYGKNLYEIGSRNIGAANVWRATGRIEALLMALIGDVGKGGLAIYLAQKFSCPSLPNFYLIIAQAVAAFFVVVGHNWPIYLKFKGGRGLAALAGEILFLNWKILILVLITIGFFIFLAELIMKQGIRLQGTLKEKMKGLLTIFISQVLGRMIGILAAVILVYILYPQIFKIAFAATVLSGIKHVKRTKTFLEEQKQK